MEDTEITSARFSRNPRILVCPDSFKGSLSAAEASVAMARGAGRALPGARLAVLPLADGGEDTVEALSRARGRKFRLRARGPLGRSCHAEFLMLPGRIAVIEMAQAAGLTLVAPSRRSPLKASTYGVGEIMKKALRHGARRIIVFTGGSATTDGGAGMAQALGARLLDSRGRDIPPGGAGLLSLRRICAKPLRRLLHGVTVQGATDVRNPLLGPRGAARMFSPQKGATPAQARLLERGLANLARVIRNDLGVDVRNIRGAGSAGGTGAGLVAFARAKLVPGAPLIFKYLGFDRHLRRANLVLTGEGSLDAQTLLGKLVAHVAGRAKCRGVPVLAFAGRVSLSSRKIRRMGLSYAHAISGRGMSRRESMRRAAVLLERATERVLSGFSRSLIDSPSSP